MKKKWTTFKIHLFTLIIFLFSGVNLNAQKEVLVGAGHSQQTTFEKKQQKQILKTQSSFPEDTIHVPLIEDFAKSVGYPNPEFWEDDLAFINHQYTENPVSIGVATLDAINADGDVYQHGNNSGFSADTLTSNPINLDFSPADSIYLSFFYQPGGLGDSPEFSDSLVVQFYDPDTMKWQSVWNVAIFQDTIHIENDMRDQTVDSVTAKNSPFRQVNLPIKQEKYLKKGFRFRFRNYASVSGYSMSIASNVDHWNLDFVRLDTARNHKDTTINDIAFVEPMKPLLNNYESTPWDHFPQANTEEMGDSIYITYKNIGDKTWNIFREFEIYNTLGSYYTSFTGGGGDDIPPYTKETYPRRIDIGFPENNKDSALFKIKSYLVTDTVSARAPYRWNDTINYNQKFFNYYAYDDGTAENGYGINGEGSEYARVALKFHNYKSDSLQGLQIFFNQTRDSTGQNFKILVWENDNGKPGEIIYSESGFQQIYEDGVNRFHNYSFNQKPYLKKGKDYFIGYQKFTTEMLNVGFDVNRINNDKLFYFVDGKWQQSGYKGTVMIRPILGDYIEPTNEKQISSVDKKDNPPKIQLHPIPARNYLNVELDDADISKYSGRIYSIKGSLVKNVSRLNRTIPIGRLSEGMYILEIINSQNVPVNRKKFMVTD